MTARKPCTPPLISRNRGRFQEGAVGLFGGSFNPVHEGHIALARQLLQLAGLDEVWFMVSPQNPLKERSTLLDDRLRYDMLRIALHGEPHLVASDYELHLPLPSYTWQTLESLRRDFPGKEFVLLIGADNWEVFPQWYRAEDIKKNCRIVVYPRRGSDISQSSLPPGVTLADTPLLDISSTDIRRRVQLGLAIDGLVPRSIAPLARRCYSE